MIDDEANTQWFVHMTPLHCHPVVVFISDTYTEI